MKTAVEGPQPDTVVNTVIGVMDLGVGVGKQPAQLKGGDGFSGKAVHEFFQVPDVLPDQIVPAQNDVGVDLETGFGAEFKGFYHINHAGALVQILPHAV